MFCNPWCKKPRFYQIYFSILPRDRHARDGPQRLAGQRGKMMDNLTKGCPTQKKTRQFNLDRTNRGRITDLNNSKFIKGRPTFKIPIYETN